MKKLIGILALAAATSCHSNLTVADKALVGAAAPVAKSAAADTLPVTMLRGCDLSSVLRTLPDNPDDATAPMNGFLGADHQRIEVVVSEVHRDPHQPARYWLRGQDRYKGCINSFAGSVDLTQVQHQGDKLNGTLKAAYTATGRFELSEKAAQAAAGTFQGRIAIDWAVTEDGKLMQHTLNIRIPGSIREYEPSTKTPTRGGGILYEGTWTSATGQTKPMVWAADLLAYHGPQILSDFVVGGRMLDVNPKYAKLGWNEYYTNDEWWAASPKPRLCL
jgi:hypothetical protein